MVIAALRRFIADQSIQGRLLLACSGGRDSTALLLAAAELRLDAVVAHVNHHLRGDDSDGDEVFVRSLAAAHGLRFERADGPLDPEEVKRSGIESAARIVRERRLHELRERTGAKWVVTAHQQNDQAETIVMRVLTGTGIAGLRGIHPVRDDRFVRPLLDVSRRSIDDFLAARGVEPRHDRSNDDPRFLRNRVRQLLGEGDPAPVAALSRQADAAWKLIEKTLDEWEREHVRASAEETRFSRWPDDPWLRQALLHRHIRRLGAAREISASDLERLAGELDAIRRTSVTRDLELVRVRGILVLRRPPEPTPDFEIELRAGSPVYIPESGSMITVTRAAGAGETTAQRFRLPQGAEPRFIVRNRRTGDRFHPLGMPSDKKLKDFLIDRKIAAELRDRIPLLIWNGEIVWVAGVEISEKFKVTGSADNLYEVSVESRSEDPRVVLEQ